MSHTTEPAIDPEEQKSIDFSDDALLKTLPLPVIALRMRDWSIQNMSRAILNMSRKRVEKRITRKAIVKIAKEVLGRIPECNDAQGVEFLSNVVLDIWPLLAISICKNMDSMGNIGVIVAEANHDSATQRWARMQADPSLKSYLANIKPATSSNYDILRLFLSIIIGYWGDKAELPKLAAATGKRHAFGFMIKFWDEVNAKNKGKPPPPEEPVLVKKISYEIKDANDAKNLGRVREWLLTEYVDDENVDVDDLFKMIKSSLLNQVKAGKNSGHFNNGSPAIVDIRLNHPWSFRVSIKLVEEDVWF